jgi:prepilin peptidase CpaA
VLTAAAAVTDSRHGLIPNWLTLPTLVLAPLVKLWIAGPEGAAFATLAALGCGVVPLALFCLGAMGGGDVKLFAALGALCGASLGLELQLASYVVSAVGALGAATLRGQLLATLARSVRMLASRGGAQPASPGVVCEPPTSVRLGASVFAAVLLLGVQTVAGTQ